MAARRMLAILVLAALLLAQAVAPSAASAAPGVLVVGDSLEVLTSPYLKKYLPGVRLTINAVGGYNSYQIYDLFQQSYDPSQSVIVFDAGTNDNPNYPQILAGNLQKVESVIGPSRCMVVPTIHGLPVGGVNSDGKNAVVHQFAASRPGTQTPDWAGAVASHPELMQPDNLHPIPAGADLRARLIARGVMGCLNPSVIHPPGPTKRPKNLPALEASPQLPLVHSFQRAAAIDLVGMVAGRLADQDPLVEGALATALLQPSAG